HCASAGSIHTAPTTAVAGTGSARPRAATDAEPGKDAPSARPVPSATSATRTARGMPSPISAGHHTVAAEIDAASTSPGSAYGMYGESRTPATTAATATSSTHHGTVADCIPDHSSTRTGYAAATAPVTARTNRSSPGGTRRATISAPTTATASAPPATSHRSTPVSPAREPTNSPRTR